MKPFAMIAAVVALGFAAWHYAAPEPQALVHLMYQTQTFPQMAVKANAVLAGQVVGIGGTRWNQDDGSFWDREMSSGQTETALPYYEITLRVDDPIVDTTTQNLAAGHDVVLTVVGMNPRDEQEIATNLGIGSGDHGPEGLQVGQRIVVFAQNTQMAWREGTRPVLQLMGHPEQAYFTTVRGGNFESHAQEAPSGSLAALKDQVLALRDGQTTE
jgi:hypothetical protein